MNFKFFEEEARVMLSGQLTFSDHPTFRTVTARLLKSAGQRLVIELQELDFVDSAGLGMLLIARDEADKAQRQLVLRSPRGQVKRMFEISKFETLFPIEG
jgi:HptB-dependent secretion and biofilm anti anti-sigma factor